MNKPYFAKYLPVEGEIKEFERAHLKEENDIVNKDGNLVTKVSTDDWLSFLWEEDGDYHFCVKKLHGSGASGITLKKDEFVKVKLFLCSRDIQVGDKYYNEAFEFTKYPNESIAGSSSEWVGENGSYKVIGVISSEAIFVKENDEFEESDVMKDIYLVHQKLWLSETGKNGFDFEDLKLYRIKCKCCGKFC